MNAYSSSISPERKEYFQKKLNQISSKDIFNQSQQVVSTINTQCFSWLSMDASFEGMKVLSRDTIDSMKEVEAKKEAKI